MKEVASVNIDYNNDNETAETEICEKKHLSHKTKDNTEDKYEASVPKNGVKDSLSLNIEGGKNCFASQDGISGEETENYFKFKRKFIYVRNNVQSIGFAAFFVAVNAALVIGRIIEYRHTNLLHIGARACGQCLNFDCALLLALILRRSITRLRNSSIGNAFPCDRHIYFHKIAGWTVFFLSILHTLFHLANFAGMSEETGIPFWSYMWDTSIGIGWIWGLANPSGIILLFLLTLITAFSHRCVRKSGKFEIFYWTHLLSLPFWVLLVIHAPNFWKWLLIPGSIFVLENVIRLHQVCSSRGRTVVVYSFSFESRVTKLIIQKPKDLEFRAGEYVYLNIPSVAKYEWHPFTISSAPEEEDVFMVHIRSVGGWTEKVFELFNNKRIIPQDDPFSTTFLSLRERKISLRGILPSSIFSREKNGALDEYQSNNGKTYRENLVGFNQIESSSPFCRTDTKNKSESVPSRDCESKTVGNKALGIRYIFDGTGHKNSSERDLDALNPTLLTPPTVVLESPEGERTILSTNKSTGDLSTVVVDHISDEKETYLEQTPMPIEVFIDGPYGSPSSNIFNVRHAVLIGAGIGVTPFASVLQSVMHRYREAKSVCPHCKIASCVSLPSSLRKLRKVDFIWVNRDLRHFEWFIELLADLEREQRVSGAAMERLLSLHLYKTGREPPQFPIPLDSAIHQGRPNWNKLLGQIRQSHNGKICVYYCGPPALAEVLRKKCVSLHLDYRKEMF